MGGAIGSLGMLLAGSVISVLFVNKYFLTLDLQVLYENNMADTEITRDGYWHNNTLFNVNKQAYIY